MSSQFLTSLREFMIARQYSKRTIHSYCYWIKAYIIFSGKRRPEDMGEKEVVDFLTFLAVKRNVAPGTQALALNALAYLYNKYLQIPLGTLGEFRVSNRQTKLPVVLSQIEVKRLLGHSDVKTTEIYTHVLNRGAHGVTRPLSHLNLLEASP